MENIPKTESAPQEESMLQEITVGELVTYLVEHPDDQQEILGGVFSAKELAGKMTPDVVLKGMEKMGLRPMTQEEVEAAMKAPPPADDRRVPFFAWNADERKMEEWDSTKDDNWSLNNRRLFTRD